MFLIDSEDNFALKDFGVGKCQIVVVSLPRFIASVDVEYYRDDIELVIPDEILYRLRVGAVIIIDEDMERNDHIYGFWTGNEIVKPDFESVTDYGFIPRLECFDVIAMDVPVGFWYDTGVLGYFEDCVWIDRSKMEKFVNENGDVMGRFTCANKTYQISMDLCFDSNENLMLLDIHDAIEID